MRCVGEWEIVERIGTGSFSTVWKARHQKTHQLAAMKEIVTAKLSDDCAKCLDVEINAMREMHHPNIVRFYEQIRVPDQFFIVMEFCNEGELQSLIKKGRSQEPFTRRCLSQLASGLKALRSAKIIHRDLKPSNLLLHDGVLKIADFGFARNLPSQSLADTLCGSPLYMAPEVLQRKKYDAAADLWSVGVILYEMLVGRTLFDGRNYIQLLSNIETKALRIPKSVAKNVSKDCLDLLVRLLQRDPHKRITFDAFFEHPFITDDLPDDGLAEDGPRPSISMNGPPPPPTALSQMEESMIASKGPTDEFTFSFDGEFCVVHRYGSSEADLEDLSAKQRRCELIAQWVMDYAQGNASATERFFLSLISVQILRHLLYQEHIEEEELQRRYIEAVAEAEKFSDEIQVGDSGQECSVHEIYGILWNDAISFSKRAAADELCGTFHEGSENYQRSVELLTFLLQEGSGVPLDPPLIISKTQKETITRLISEIKSRRAECMSTHASS